MIKNYLKIIGVGLLFTACQKIFVPKIDNVPTALVVEGYLSTQSGVQTVLLTHSASFDGRPDYQQETGATVYVTDDQGNRFDYHENGNTGVYRTDILDQVKGAIGQTYVLHIETKEGDVYESTPQTIQECPTPYRLICKPAREEVLTEDAYGAPVETFLNGIDVDVSSHGVLPNKNFYQYDWNGYIEHFTTVTSGLAVYYFYQHSRLTSKDLYLIRTGNADGISDHTIRDKKVLFISFQDIHDFIPTLPDTDTVYTTFFMGLLFKIQQRSLTPDAYQFWNGAENQLDANGSLFDPVASQIQSNIHCVSDSTKPVYGIFTAYDEKDKYAYFYAKSNRVISEDIDSFPQLVLDTFMLNTIPKGWINPPF